MEKCVSTDIAKREYIIIGRRWKDKPKKMPLIAMPARNVLTPYDVNPMLATVTSRSHKILPFANL